MSISIRKYVDIVSGVGAGASVRQRDLIGNLFTTNTKVPIDTRIEMTDADSAGTFFGTTSVEYLRAAFYFAFIGKNITRAKKIAFTRWADVAAAPRVYGSRTLTTLAAWKLITAGTLTMNAGTTINLTALNFSAAVDLAGVASILQTAIRAAGGAQFVTAVVAYDAVGQTFNFTGTVAGASPISVTVTGTANDIAGRLGWGPAAVMSPGTAAQTLTDTLIAAADNSNNFGSFLFIPTLTTDQIIEVATWNSTRNVEFMFVEGVDDTNYVALSAALINMPGTALTYVGATQTEYDDMIPMIVLAATDYNRRNSVQNYMFQQFPTLTAKVKTTSQSNALDLVRVNYYGQTQTAGQLINFYQRGVMGGPATSPVDQNIYANEMWLKDAAAAVIMSLLLAKAKVSANNQGRGEIIAVINDAITRALFNGVISVGKTLTTIQKLYITDQTGDEFAWRQVENIGYWLDCNMASYTTLDGRVEWKAVYVLIYGKDDVIRKVEGTHVLI